jgi:Domain of unknown function (DUF4440)
MKSLILFLLLVAAACAAPADDAIIAAVRAADDERVAATRAADRVRLEAIFSDQLHYAHSSGKIDTKASYVESIINRTSVYASYDYVRRDFLRAADGIVLMPGRVRINAGTATETNLLDLNFLAVWRLEQGKWRFLAWQSCKNPPPAAAK